MGKNKGQGIFYLLVSLVVKILCNDIFNFLVNLGFTILIGIHTANIESSEKWWHDLILWCVVFIIINILVIICKTYTQKVNKWNHLIEVIYNNHNELYCEMSSQIFRINKKITETIRADKAVTIDIYNKIYDFQSLSMSICKSIYNIVTNEVSDCSCQVTIFQRFLNSSGKDEVRMIAYATCDMKEPASYHMVFPLSGKGKDKTVFQRCFLSKENIPVLYHKKKQIDENFEILSCSKNRESKIHQYVGIPIKSNRDKVEFVLQIDVTKKSALGRTHKQINRFYEIVKPYSNLLLMSYERELVFNKFYEILENNLPQGDEKVAN